MKIVSFCTEPKMFNVSDAQNLDVPNDLRSLTIFADICTVRYIIIPDMYVYMSVIIVYLTLIVEYQLLYICLMQI